MSGREIRLSDEQVGRVLSPEHFIAVRRTWGCPAPETVGAATDAASASLENDRAGAARRHEILAAAESILRTAVDAI